MERFKRMSGAVGWAIVIGFSLLSITQAVASVFGLMSGLIVISGSMEPAISTGSYVIARPVEASAVEVGDIVAVRSQDGRSIIHRVVSVDDGPEDTMLLRLQGDANNAIDDEVYVVSSVLSPVMTIPGLGYALAYAVDAKKLVTTNPVLTLGAAVGAGLLIWSVRSGRAARAEEPDEAPMTQRQHSLRTGDTAFRFVRFPPPITPQAPGEGSGRHTPTTGDTAFRFVRFPPPITSQAPGEGQDDTSLTGAIQ